MINRPYSIFAAQSLLNDLNLKPGEQFIIGHVDQSAKFVVLDALSSEGLAIVEGGRVAVTDIATFQEFTGVFGKVDRIDLLFEPNVSKKQIEQVREILPEGILLAMPGEDRLSGNTMISAYQLNLSVLSFVSLFVGMFLVYSLVALNAASRRKELAVLRSTGASAGIVFFIFIAEYRCFRKCSNNRSGIVYRAGDHGAQLSRNSCPLGSPYRRRGYFYKFKNGGY